MAGASPSSCLGARARGSGLSPSSQPPSPPSPKGVMDGVSSLAAQSVAAPAPATPEACSSAPAAAKPAAPLLASAPWGRGPRISLPSLSPACFLLSPLPPCRCSLSFSHQLSPSPPRGGKPQRGMPKAPRKGGQVAPSRAAADLVIIKRPATLGNSFSSLIPAGN